MSYEPRSRSRSLRPHRLTAKKTSRDRKDEEEAYIYREPVLVDSGQLSASVMNALGHLGNQRFPLPPFSEHFNRWTKDIDAVLAEFTASLPDAADDEYKSTISKLIGDVKGEFDKRIQAETKLAAELSELQHQLATCELELSMVEQEERKRKEEVKRGHEKSKRKLLNEIEVIDRRRLNLLRKKPTVLERIFGRSKAELEDSTSKIQARKQTLEGTEKGFQLEMNELKTDYEARRKKLVERDSALKEKLSNLKSSSVDDALEIRKRTCEALRQAVAGSVQRLNMKPKKENAQEKTTISNH